MWPIDQNVDRLFRTEADGSVTFVLSAVDAYVVPSPERQAELRAGMRRFMISSLLFGISLLVVSFGGRATMEIWMPIEPRAAQRATAIASWLVRGYLGAGIGWLWWLQRRLVDGLQSRPPSSANSAWLQRAARRTTRNRLRIAAGCGAVAAVGAAFAPVAFWPLGRTTSDAVVLICVGGIAWYVWSRVVLAAFDASPLRGTSTASAGDCTSEDR